MATISGPIGFLQLTPYLAVALLVVLALLVLWRRIRKNRSGSSCHQGAGKKPQSRPSSCGNCRGCAGDGSEKDKCGKI